MNSLFQRLYDTYLSVSATSFGRVTKHVDECPHCQTRTTWSVRILTGYAQCEQCGCNPLNQPDQPPTDANRSEPTAPRPAAA